MSVIESCQLDSIIIYQQPTQTRQLQRTLTTYSQKEDKKTKTTTLIPEQFSTRVQSRGLWLLPQDRKIPAKIDELHQELKIHGYLGRA